jgi:AcrR family transcriptional regulator
VSSQEPEPPPPIWARPEPPGRHPRAALSRRQIVDAALLIADADGLDAVSMRRLARELGAGAMSLYHYFDTRDELLELMSDSTAGEMLVAKLPGDWRAALRAIAHETRDTFVRHPWMLSTLQERPYVSPNMLRHIEQSAQAVMGLEGRVEPHLLTSIVVAVDDYTVGFTLRELGAGRPGEHGKGVTARFAETYEEPNVRYLLESGEFPLLARFAAGGADMPAQDFDTGLDWLLDGFAARIERGGPGGRQPTRS